jgi:hypothetical protein
MNRLSGLVLSERNPHLLATEDGKPFPILGDTAWELLHRLTLEEIEEYFQTRARQGFNAVWLNLLPEFDGLKTPNRYGDIPFVDLDELTPSVPISNLSIEWSKWRRDTASTSGFCLAGETN